MTIAEQAYKALTNVKDAGTGKSLLDLGWLDQVRIDPPKAIVRLTLPDFANSQRDQFAKQIREELGKFKVISEIQIELGNSTTSSPIGQAGHGQQPASIQAIPGVKQIIAVSSGKGGVGKSTVAVNLACALAKQGLQVGLLDADIYGPNTPIMMGVEDQIPEVKGEGADQEIIPIETFGIAMVSMGLLINEAQPVIWRGPMLNGIIRQFLYQASWGIKDVLVVDLPPGTGDAQLSLAQAVPMAGVIIVTTPQMVSLQDARRGLAMFRQMNVPILGVVENMTSFITPDDPKKSYALFGEGGGERLSTENEVPLLAQIPMEMPTEKCVNESMPIIHQDPESITAKIFSKLAKKIYENLYLE